MRSIQEICRPDYSLEEIQAWGGRAYREEMRIQGIQSDFVWVVENQGKIEGFAHLKFYPEKKQAELMGLYLTPVVLKKGLGRRLLALVEEVAREHQLQTITLKSTITALSFYRHHGYQEDGPSMSVPINGVPVHCHPLLKKLSTP
ncbi:MAG: GNAT family N-acetyltransferase [Planctomycetota bacterium]